MLVTKPVCYELDLVEVQEGMDDGDIDDTLMQASYTSY